MANGYRQEVFNVLLAQLLQERGVVTAPETIVKSGLDQARRMPDVIVSFRGLRVVIEGEVADQPNAEGRALESARKRVKEGIAHVGVAVIYPSQLRKEEFSNLKPCLAGSDLRIAIVTESEDTGFVKGNVGYLGNALRRAFEQLVREDVVTQAVAALDVGIQGFAGVIASKAGVVGRLARTLGIRELPQGASTGEEESE